MLKKVGNQPHRRSVLQRMQQQRDLFWKLLEPEYERALMFCRKLMGERESGDDLYQDGLVMAFTRFSELRDTASFRPWLYRVLVNAFKSTVRRPWPRRRVSISGDVELDLVVDNPVDQYTARRWLSRAFEAVSPDEQALITLHELEGWSVGELAELLGRSEGSVKTKLFRARRKMKQALTRLVGAHDHRRRETTLWRRSTQCGAVKPDAE